MRTVTKLAAGLSVSVLSLLVAGPALPKAGIPIAAITHYGNGGISLPAGNTQLDSAKFQCDFSEQCFFVTSATVELTDGGSTNPWSICVFVDGKPAKPHCPNQPDLSADHSSSGTALQDSVKLPVGQHVVSVHVNLSGAGTLGSWNALYTVYEAIKIHGGSKL